MGELIADHTLKTRSQPKSFKQGQPGDVAYGWRRGKSENKRKARESNTTTHPLETEDEVNAKSSHSPDGNQRETTHGGIGLNLTIQSTQGVQETIEYSKENERWQ